MKRRPCLLAAVLCLLAQLIVLYHHEYFAAVCIVAIVFEIISIAFFITGRAWINPLVPVIFLTIFCKFDNVVKKNELFDLERGNLIVQCESEGLVGKVVKVEDKGERQQIFIKKIAVGEKKTTGIVVYTDELPDWLSCGCLVRIRGELLEFERAANPGQFDSCMYNRALGYEFRAFSPKLSLVKKESSFYSLINAVKDRLRYSLGRISSGEDLGVWLSILLGDKGELAESIKELFSEGGISHILAISGLHISFIGMAVFWLLRCGTGSYPVGALAGCVFLFGYLIMTGASVSSIRAFIMLLLTLCAACLGRTPDMLSSMSVSWIIVSFMYPYQITQAGCLLSFAAILGVGLVLPVLNSLFPIEKRKGEGILIKLVRKGLEAILCTFSVSITTWPVLAWFYYELPIYSIFINLLVIPLTSLLFGSLLTAAIAGIFFEGLGSLLLLPAHYILVYYKRLCDLVSRLPGHLIVTGRPNRWQLVTYIGLFGLAVFVIHLVNLYRERKRILIQPVSKTGVINRGILPRAVYLLGILFLTILGAFFLIRKPDEGLTVVFMDIGQGDACLIREGDYTAFIDGGSSSVNSAGEYRIKPMLLYYGVSRVDHWIVTHSDDDHENGLMELLNSYDQSDTPRIQSVVTPFAGHDNESWDELFSLCKRNGIRSELISTGMAIDLGKLRLLCLYPDREESFSGTNDLCSVMKLIYGSTSFIFTGDISEPVEKTLAVRYEEASLEKAENSLVADILKVAHHGSRYSSCEEFLELVGARLAVISVGKNTYGHPSPDVIYRLTCAGAIPLRTDLCGAIEIISDGETIKLKKYREE